MLTMRSILLTLISFVLAWNVSAQSPGQPLPHTNHAQQEPESDERGTEQAPLIIKVLPPLNEGEKAAAEKQERQDKSESDWWLIKLTGVLAFIGVLQLVVFALQAFRLNQSVREMKIATKATEKAADAAIVASMPVLSPLIVGGILHPFRTTAEHLYHTDNPVTFNSSVHFVFENFGKTPGMIREVRGDLFLCEMDQFPTVDFGQLPVIDYQPIIAGDSRGQEALMGVAECVKPISLTQTEFTELLSPSDNKYRRFAFIGRVIYDDFFDNRHTRRFCIKLRLMDTGLFQLVRGGKAYNHVDRQAIPENE
jgi:hypothetical protein